MNKKELEKKLAFRNKILEMILNNYNIMREGQKLYDNNWRKENEKNNDNDVTSTYTASE